jgi:predicted ATPase
MFRDVTIDKLPNCCVGANGTGKTSLFDLFGFLREALTSNLKQTLAKRGGFNDVVSRETVGPIELELTFRNLRATSSLVSYLLIIDLIENRPVVKREVLKYWPKQPPFEPQPIIDFSLGSGKVIGDENAQQLSSPDRLALKEIGQFQHVEIAGELCQFIKNWHFSDIQLSEARKINQATGYDKHLSSNGDNLALFAQRMHNHYSEQYQEIMHQMAYRLPSISSVEPMTTADGRIFLNFHHSTFKEPF